MRMMLRAPRLCSCCVCPPLVPDASREMATTTWLAAFEGTHLVLPGFTSGYIQDDMAAGDSGMATSWRSWRRAITLYRPASAEALSTYLLVLRYSVQGVAGLIYLGVRRRASFRFGMLVAAAVLSSGSGLCLLWGGQRWWCGWFTGRHRRNAVPAEAAPKTAPGDGEKGEVGAHATAAMSFILTACWPGTGVSSQPSNNHLHGSDDMDCIIGSVGRSGADSVASCSVNGSPERAQARQSVAQAAGGVVADPAHALVLWPWQLSRWELSLVFFLIVARGLPAQSSDTVLAYLSSSAAVPDTIAAAVDGGSEAARDLAETLLPPVRGHTHSLYCRRRATCHHRCCCH